MMASVRKLLELIRFSHTVFALPLALLAAAMAWTANAHETPPVAFRVRDFLGILLCMVFARSAAMAFNRLVDRKIDALNPRTAVRHLPAGTLSVPAVALFAVASGAAFVGATLLFLPNWLPLALSLPVLAFLFGYSYTKRFSAVAHFWLGGGAHAGPHFGLDRGSRTGGDWPAERSVAGLGPGSGGAALGGRIRYHLCVPRRRVRPPGWPAQRAGPPGGG
jgi:4-hydroxybenzoate polyprenyltransferase